MSQADSTSPTPRPNRRWRKRAIQAARALGILTVVSGLVGVGLVWGPRPAEVQASVYQEFLSRWGEAPFIPSKTLSEGKPHPLFMNGQRIDMQHLRVDASVQEVLDYYDENWRDTIDFEGDPGLAQMALNHPELNVPSMRDHHRRMVNDIAQRGVHIKQTEQNGRFGYLMRIRMLDRPDSILDALGQTTKKLMRFIESGDLSDLGPSLVVQAFSESTNGPTEVLLFTPSESFNYFDAIAPLSNGDLPGSDPAEIPRYPGSVREFSVVQPGRLNVSSFTLYRASVDSDDLYSFYEREMPNEGWAINPMFHQTLSIMEERSGLFFQRPDDGREAMLRIERADADHAYVAVQIRQPS